MAGTPGKSGRKKGHSGGGDTSKRNPIQRKIDYVEMVKMLRRGYTKMMVAAELGLSCGQITYDWKIVLKEMAQTQTKNFKVVKARIKEGIAEVMREAWAGYERSKEDMIRRIEKNIEGAMGGKTEDQTITEGRVPMVGFLQTVLNCWMQIRELEGMGQGSKIELSGTGVIDFDLVLKEVEAVQRGQVQGKVMENLPPYLEHKVVNPGINGTNGHQHQDTK